MSSTHSSLSPPSDLSPLENKQSSSDSSLSPPSDHSPPEKKQKLESGDGNDGKGDVSGHDKETLTRMMDDHGPVRRVYTAEERDIIEEQIQQYRAAVEASGGFDVPSLPNDITWFDIIIPVLPLDDHDHEEFRPLCVAAMDYYNKLEGTNYVFLKLEKANAKASRGIKYYLTFVGRVPEVNTTKTFEAVVLMGIPNKAGEPQTEVYSCREKACPVTAGTSISQWMRTQLQLSVSTRTD